MDQTEAELESFRRQWREEVSAKSRTQATSSNHPPLPHPAESSAGKHGARRKSIAPPPPASSVSASKQKAVDDDWEGYQPRSYHDIEERESGVRLGDAGTAATAPKKEEPMSALEHYEEAVKKENIGSLGDSINLYRKAFRLDDKVHEAYKNKHFPPSSFKPPPKPTSPGAAQSTTATTVPTSGAPPATASQSQAPLTGLTKSLSDLVSSFSHLSIEGEPAPTELSPPPPCPIASLPEELLVEILVNLAVQDVSSLGRLVQVCKRMAYLVLTEDRIWKRVALGCEYGFAAMLYNWTCRLDGKPLGDDGFGGRLLSSAAFPSPKRAVEHGAEVDDEDEDTSIYRLYNYPVQSYTTLVPSPYPNHLSMFRTRPRLRFGGVYISTVNYTRPGASSPNQISWNSPVLIVTYYRYLRFFRDGTVISLLTTHEPAEVVGHMIPENVRRQPQHHGGGKQHAPASEPPIAAAPHVMKDALRGRWRLSGPQDKAHPTYVAKAAARAAAIAAASEEGEPVAGELAEEEEEEEEGTVHVETEGVIPKYMYRMSLSIGSAGRGAKSNKLSWKGYWSYNKLTDDWAEFGLKNDRAFYWSRVRRFAGA